jgi:AcrR family transcriptional regulator
MASEPKQAFGVPSQGEIALILAAERIFAEQGIKAVPLRRINQAANQKNMSATHYHFGSRDGLVRAVLKHRLPDLDRRRGALLAGSAESKGLHFYLNAFVGPLIQELLPKPEGNYFIRFMQQYERYRADYALVRELTPQSVALYDNVERLIGYLPETVRQMRIGYLINIVHSVLATVEERLGKEEGLGAQIPLIAANLIDMVANALTAPLSAETIELLSRTSAQLDPGRNVPESA